MKSLTLCLTILLLRYFFIRTEYPNWYIKRLIWVERARDKANFSVGKDYYHTKTTEGWIKVYSKKWNIYFKDADSSEGLILQSFNDSLSATQNISLAMKQAAEMHKMEPIIAEMEKQTKLQSWLSKAKTKYYEHIRQ